jgi:hypothetical protein
MEKKNVNEVCIEIDATQNRIKVWYVQIDHENKTGSRQLLADAGLEQYQVDALTKKSPSVLFNIKGNV